MTALEIALSYISRGWNPVPVPYRHKKPVDDEWQHRVINAANAAQYFNNKPQNIGAQMGPTSNGLSDADLDCVEAVALAPYILPPTKAIFGRASSPYSHWLYSTNLGATIDAAALQFRNPKTKEMLVELRIGGGGKGAQTIFPGSTHKETGEEITWFENGEPAPVTGLDKRVHLLAACCLLARYWPPATGSRHNYALTIGGFLSRVGIGAASIKVYVEGIARAAGDEEWRDRRKAAEDAANAHHAGKRTYGLKALRDLYGPEVANSIAEWLGYQSSNEPREEKPADNRINAPEADATLTSVRASTVTPTAIQWLWPNRFALGKLSILAGLPDEGKGQIFADVAARVTNGAEWPCNEGRAPKGNVVLLTAEDDISDTVVPRLIAAGADLSCVEIVSMVRTGDKTRMFSLMTDLTLLRQKIIAVGNVNLVLIDPVSAYQGIGKVDSFRTNDVRALLGPLVELAGDLMAAVLGIMHFNKKTDVTNALLRISDSLAYGATARGVYCVVDDAENDRKLLVKGKNNIAPKNQPALAYGFGVEDVGRDPKTGATIFAPHILWHPDHVDVTATEAMDAANNAKSPAARDSAKKFLADMLASGPIKKTDIDDAAEANGIARRTLFRAKDELGVVAKKGNSGSHDGWSWQMPHAATRWGHD